jgi:purine nucleosidase
MKFIIDTDMGVDDAVALLMALAQPDAEVAAITSVLGNVSLAQATHNVGVVLDVAQAPLIPIFQGCARPLLQYEAEDAVSIHGEDGLGGAGKPETTRRVEKEHASLAMSRLARESPGELTLLTLGPLTNVALAIRLDPAFPSNLRNLVIMGGAVDGRGNTTAPTEFNVGVDPEAAKIVLAACRDVPGEVWLIPWETALIEAVSFAEWEAVIGGDSAAAKFLQRMSVHVKQVMVTSGYSATIWPDPLAAAVALAPDIVLAQKARFVDVEVGAGLARGQTIVDYRNNSPLSPNVTIVRRVDRQRFKNMLRLGAQL